MTGNEEKRGPGRPRIERSEQVTQERRRRSDSTLTRMAQQKLSVPDGVRADNPGQSFRWVNDSGTRMHDLTVQDDWTKVKGVAPIPVGTDNFGKPVTAHLCMKPTEWLESDAKEKVAATVEQERALMRGQRAPEDQRADGESYVPEGNSISSGGYRP